MRTRTAALAAMTAVIAMVLPSAATASSERMSLTCDSGTLAGRTLERSNGASWWDVSTGDVYTTVSLVVSSGDEEVHRHHYGAKAGDHQTCLGDHFDFTWDVVLVASAARS